MSLRRAQELHHENPLAPHFWRTVLHSTTVADCTQRLPKCSHLGTGTGVMPHGPSNPWSFQLWLEILRMGGTGEGRKLFFLVFMGHHVLFAGGGDNGGGLAHPCANICWDNSGTRGSSTYQLP